MTPSEGTGKAGSSNLPITIEKEVVEGDKQIKKTQEADESAVMKDYEAFKRFQVAQENYKTTKKKSVEVVNEHMSFFSEDTRPRRKISRGKGVREETSEEEERTRKKPKRRAKKILISSEESEEEMPKRRKAKKKEV